MRTRLRPPYWMYPPGGAKLESISIRTFPAERGDPQKHGKSTSESGGGYPGGTGSHPEGAARSRRRHMLRRACPRLVSPFARLLLGTFLGGTRKVQTPLRIQGPRRGAAETRFHIGALMHFLKLCVAYRPRVQLRPTGCPIPRGPRFFFSSGKVNLPSGKGPPYSRPLYGAERRPVSRQGPDVELPNLASTSGPSCTS